MKFVPRNKIRRPSKNKCNSEREIFKDQLVGFPKMKETLAVSQIHLQADLQKKNLSLEEIYSDDETQYLTMMNEENLRDDTKSFFDVKIHGENN